MSQIEIFKNNHMTVTVDREGMDDSFTRVFDHTNPQWSPNPNYNLVFLRAQLAYMQDTISARGHLFLNEAFDILGFPRTAAGAVLGWTREKRGPIISYEPKGDAFEIDFWPSNEVLGAL